MSFIWTDERVETLKRMWADGLSASQIAARFSGLTRNAVLGKAHRLGLGTHKLAFNPDRPRVAKEKPDPVIRPKKVKLTPPPVKAAPKEPIVDVLKPVPFMKQLVELECSECVWPENDGGPFLFCGHPKHNGGPYCEYHHLVSVGPGTRSERMVAPMKQVA